MSRSLSDTRRWVATGTALCLDTVAGLGDDDFDAPSGLPGWTRKHVIAHLAANAEACGRLIHWAATGEPTPMYPSVEARAAGIEAGALRPPTELRDWLTDSSTALVDAMDALTDAQWHNEIITGRGRRVEATEVAWMRAREVCLHAVDLDTGVTFADLPADFLAAQCDDAAEFRAAGATSVEVVTEAGRWRIGNDDTPPHVSLSLPGAAAYLVGRHIDVAGLPVLAPWI